MMVFFMSLFLALSFVKTSEAQSSVITFDKFEIVDTDTKASAVIDEVVTFIFMEDKQVNYSNVTIITDRFQDCLGQRTEFRQLSADNQIYTANFNSINDNSYFTIYVDKDRNNITIVNDQEPVLFNFIKH